MGFLARVRAGLSAALAPDVQDNGQFVAATLEQRSAGGPRVRSIDEISAEYSSTWGRHVTVGEVLEAATAWACIRVRCDGVAVPALGVFEAQKDGKRREARDHELYRLLATRPNEFQTSLEFRRTMHMLGLLTGDGVALKVRVNGRLRELIPIPHVNIERPARYEVIYNLYDRHGLIARVGPEDVFHLPMWQQDGVQGLNSTRLLRHALGLAIEAEKSQSNFYANGGRPSGVLSSDANHSPEVVEKVRTAFKKFQKEQKQGTPVLDGAWKYQPITMSSADAQTIEMRRLQIEEICRGYNVFPIMVGHSDKTATFASAEAFFAAHRVQTVAPDQAMWRQRIDEFLLDGSGPYFADFDNRFMASASIKDLALYVRTMVETNTFMRNEIRDDLGRDPLDGLDDPYIPPNMAKSGADNAPPDAP